MAPTILMGLVRPPTIYRLETWQRVYILSLQFYGPCASTWQRLALLFDEPGAAKGPYYSNGQEDIEYGSWGRGFLTTNYGMGELLTMDQWIKLLSYMAVVSLPSTMLLGQPLDPLE